MLNVSVCVGGKAQEGRRMMMGQDGGGNQLIYDAMIHERSPGNEITCCSFYLTEYQMGGSWDTDEGSWEC